MGAFLTLLIDLSFPTLGNLIKICQIPTPCPHAPPPPPHGVYIDRCITNTSRHYSFIQAFFYWLLQPILAPLRKKKTLVNSNKINERTMRSTTKDFLQRIRRPSMDPWKIREKIFIWKFIRNLITQRLSKYHLREDLILSLPLIDPVKYGLKQRRHLPKRNGMNCL